MFVYVVFMIIKKCVWVASLVDRRVFWQPGSVLMFYCSIVTVIVKLSEPNKYLLLLHCLKIEQPNTRVLARTW